MHWFKKGSIGFIIVIIIGAIIALWLLKAPLMSSYLSKKLGVDVSMLGITIRPSYTKIYHFKIANPRNFRSPKAFSAKKIRIDYKWNQLTKDPTTIQEITINDAYLGIEFSNPLGTSNNWTAIGANLPKKKDKGKGFIIRRLVITNLQVEIRGMGIKGLTGQVQRKTIPRLVFTNINSEKGFPTEQLIKAIFGSAGLQNYIQNLLSPGGVIDEAIKPFFKLFGDREDSQEEYIEKNKRGSISTSSI